MWTFSTVTCVVMMIVGTQLQWRNYLQGGMCSSPYITPVFPYEICLSAENKVTVVRCSAPPPPKIIVSPACTPHSRPGAPSYATVALAGDSCFHSDCIKCCVLF